MRALSSELRKRLEKTVLDARRTSESESRRSVEGLGVFARDKPAHLDSERAHLRNDLRARWRQLGEDTEALVAECAYEQWHRLLFARFLAENGLLLHPGFKAAVSLADCEDLAAEMGEPDGWSVAARFAAEILPGIFRVDDPCVRLRLAPEGRVALEAILAGLPVEVFLADDALGWVYQFWQKDRKDEINRSERKIGGADLGPVTQLFTESYMVRFLLENSLGAWWAAHHPDSALVKGFEYLRFDDEGHPAAGSFDGWPEQVGQVTVMDPCCGSGHFLVEAFSMLWQMRAEEEGLSPVEAADAVLSDNLFGLELDPRCVQIAMFAVAMKAWKDGGAWRVLPIPNIACSGIPVNAPVEDWKNLAGGDERLVSALVRLHALFQDADTLGSLIDPPASTAEDHLLSVDYSEVAPLLEKLLRVEPEGSTMGIGPATGVAIAAALLARRYTLVTTNVPYLGVQRMPMHTAEHLTERYPSSANDLATVFIERCIDMAPNGTIALVTPLGWLFLRYYGTLRRILLKNLRWDVLAPLGPGAFETVTGQVVQSTLVVMSSGPLVGRVAAVDATKAPRAHEKAQALRANDITLMRQEDMRDSPDTLLALDSGHHQSLLSAYADSWKGLVTSDVAQYIVRFWEVSAISSVWERFLTAPKVTAPHAGRECLLRWESGAGRLKRKSGATNFNPKEVLGTLGVLVGSGTLNVTLYRGEMFNDASVPIIPKDQDDVSGLWAYLSSVEYRERVRRVNHKIVVGCGYLLKVPFDPDEWRRVAREGEPLPEPWSDDPTQWLFEGRPEVATDPLQVAVARLLGYRWPEQAEHDDLDCLADEDGIVCLASVAGEAPAGERLVKLLATAFGDRWSPGKATELLAQAGAKSKDLADWLRDEFFKAHCGLFHNRPFIWHIWDGRRDGFGALVNYHRLDHATLEKLTYTYLGKDWVERQRGDVRDEVPGAEARLVAALELKRKLEGILVGEDPYDIYVRWKAPHEQPMGWEPDLDDGVRLNIRPLVTAGVLRVRFRIHWRKDRGKDPGGAERRNDIHLTLTEKRSAREREGQR